MITFGQVSAEFRSLVERRRRQVTFLFSCVAALALLTDGAVHQQLPAAFTPLGPQLMPFAGGVLFALALLTSLREARLYRGMVYNGELYEALLLKSNLLSPVDRRASMTFNPFGVSFVIFLIAHITQICILSCLLLAYSHSTLVRIVVLVPCLVLPIIYFVRQNFVARQEAADRLCHEDVAETMAQLWHTHLAASIDDAHRDMLELLALAGLLTFCCFQILGILGLIERHSIATMAHSYNLATLTILVYLALLSGVIFGAYVRLRLAVGRFSVLLDPWDKPFRAGSFDDSFFGLAILTLLLGADVSLLMSLCWSGVRPQLLAAQAGVYALVLIAIERSVLYLVGRGQRQPAPKSSGTPPHMAGQQRAVTITTKRRDQ